MARFRIENSRDGQFYGVFDGDNYEPMWWTETYRSKASAENAIAVIKRLAATAPIVDNTKKAAGYRL